MKTISFDDALDINLTQRQLEIASGKKRRGISRREVEEAVLDVFELVGGVPRLALWANNPDNYGEFLKLYAKLLPKEAVQETKGGMVYQTLVPPSALNRTIEQYKEMNVATGPSQRADSDE